MTYIGPWKREVDVPSPITVPEQFPADAPDEPAPPPEREPVPVEPEKVPA